MPEMAGPFCHARRLRAIFPATSAEIRFSTNHWAKGACDPILASRFWKRISLRDAPANYSRLDAAIEAALAARRADFQPCPSCGQEFPPEHRTGDACRHCAFRYLAIACGQAAEKPIPGRRSMQMNTDQCLFLNRRSSEFISGQLNFRSLSASC